VVLKILKWRCIMELSTLEDGVKLEVLSRIEKALGFELYEWQKEYLFENKEIPESIRLGRANGKTIIQIVKFILTEKEIYAYNIEMLVYRSRRWFRNEFLRIHEKLTDVGLETVMIMAG
jgi:hypothetical protein